MTSIYFWVAFNAVILTILWIDLKVLHKEAHALTLKESLIWTGFVVSLALLFNTGIYFFMGKEKALQFLTGYIIEESLSVDNLFVFMMIFDYFNVEQKYQARVLHWGIMGALVMRFVMIFLGVHLLETFHWMIYLFGLILIFTGLKMAFEQDKKLEPEKNPLLRLFRKWIPIAPAQDQNFFVRIDGRLHATPLFVVLLMIESSDLVFAIDSIPAILAITTDTFIVYTSNVFAILGLRALYFLLSGIIPYFRFLKFGISIILCWVGVKMLISKFLQIPTMASLVVVIGIITLSVLTSILFAKKETSAPTKDKPQ